MAILIDDYDHPFNYMLANNNPREEIYRTSCFLSTILQNSFKYSGLELLCGVAIGIYDVIKSTAQLDGEFKDTISAP